MQGQVHSSHAAVYGLSAVDATALFIFLEDCGFEVDPEMMVRDVLPDVQDLSYMTSSELDVFAYTRTRHRKRCPLRPTEQTTSTEPMRERIYRTSPGYKIEALTLGDTPIQLLIRGPKWRKQKREDFTCPACGMQYEKGDPEAGLSHRKYHTRVAPLLYPKPDKDMQQRQISERSPEMVTGVSPLWMHRAMYERAWAFKREFGYDFIQWTYPRTRPQREADAIGFLMTAADGSIDGACAFRNGQGEWSMDWIWIRPEKRQSGLLIARWPAFIAQFGDFWIERPVSDAMSAFINKHGTLGQKTKISERMRG